ncbi:MAG: glycyl-radical enzyme activating protein [Smithellaceae bacterium]|nr:glycyl-radical enzyme activating protein [Smithellaceae bacterium]
MTSAVSETIRGLVFSIQRYSIHDGPGIRTTVFLKGCPLRCKWCSNPESLQPRPELMFRKVKCDLCGSCVAACPRGAVVLQEEKLEIDREMCDSCGECIAACPKGAFEMAGRLLGVAEVLTEVRKDDIFYLNSSGGMTLSGGEPLMQGEFAIEVLKACKRSGLHTTLDTSGYVAREVLEQALEFADLVLFDVKHLDAEEHKSLTGVDNGLIQDNLRVTVASGARVWIRVPVIPGFNDSPDDIRRLAKGTAKLAVEKVSLLGYHEWGKQKYECLGRTYPLEGLIPPTEERLGELARIIEAEGLQVTIGY